MKPLSRKESKVLLATEDHIGANLKGIQRNTGLHRSRVQSSLRFLESTGAIQQYYPKIAFDNIGFRALTFGFFGTDKTMVGFRKRILKEAAEDRNCSILAEILGLGKYDVFSSEMYRSIEEYHFSNREKYYDKYGQMEKFIKERIVLHVPLPLLKCENVAATILRVLEREKGRLSEAAHKYRGDTRLDDPVRRAMLAALLKPGSLSVDWRAVSDATRVREAEVREIVNRLKKRGVLRGYAPLIDYSAYGFKLRSFSLLKLDYSRPTELKNLSKLKVADPYNTFVGQCLISDPWDLVVGSLHRNVDEYTKYIQSYHSAIVYDKLVSDRLLFHLDSPHLKACPFSMVALGLLQ